MSNPSPLKVAALVDLPRTSHSGGHVKCWERLAQAATTCDLPIDLTVYFSGDEGMEVLAPHVRLRHLPPVFSTARLKFLPYVPDHTDLSPWHPRLARALSQYDLIHTTDGFFAFAQTAARVSRKRNIPLTTSFHTDTPAYTRLFTRQTLEQIFKRTPTLRNTLINNWDIPNRQGDAMLKKLRQHVAMCRKAMVTRPEDHALAEGILGNANVGHLRLGIDKNLFSSDKNNRAGVERDYAIPPGRTIFLFVGRVDIGKNIYTLVHALRRLIDEGNPLHLIVAGEGPARDDVKNILGNHATLPGYVKPEELARLYASVDGLALSSEVEIRSMAGVEAMATHCPVIVSEKSGVAELFDHTPAMMVVPSVGDGVTNWANALREFTTQPARQQAMRTAAATYASTKLASWGDVLRDDVFAMWAAAAQKSQSKVA